MVAVYDNWERLVQATLRREELRISGLRTPSDVSLASSSLSISFSFSSSSRPPLSSFEFSGRLVGDKFSYQQILEATDYLSSKNLIKHGCHGDLFYGVLEGGTQVLVKKVDLSSMEKESYLRSELQFFNKVSHFRFVPLLGLCLENWSEKFLVYEYMPGKDLSSSLNREKDSPSPLLDWKTMLRIATGAAEGLCYLHHECVPPLVHRNVEAGSILLDENFEVRLGNLHEVCVEKKRRNQSRISKLLRLPKGSEQDTSDTSKETRAYDVYCFGKVLLELVTGKKNFSADNDSSTRDWMANSLPYITPYDRGLCVNILDPSLFMDTIINPSLIRDEHLLLEVSAVAVVAKACLSAEPSKRPQMTYILEALQDPKSVRFSAHGSPQSGAQGPALAKTRVPKGYKLAGTSVATTRAKFSGSNTASLSHQFSAASWEDESHLNKEIEDLSDLRIYSFSELKAATRNFRKDGILGEGGFGRVYKGWISTSKSGTKSPIAVKRVKHESMTEFHEWQNEIDIPGKLSHPNLIKLLGYCWENEELMLVYEFMQRGSLENHLFGRGSNIQPLPWDIRLKILIGVARGLAFLHASKKQVIHRDIRSSNIFLDGSFNAKIAGFLLARPGPSDGDTHVTTRVMGICGYAAPEYVATGHLYVKSDVYSFGVIMIEVLSGLRTLDLNRPVGQHYLADWIKPHLSDKRKLQSILDTKLQGKYPIKATVKMAQLALTCLSPEPKARPSMKEVVDALENIKSTNDKPKEPRTDLTR